MPEFDPRIDAYIERQAEFAQPILRHIRAVVHAGCPAVEETLKWSSPTFMHEGILCGMAGFKEHCIFHFWKGELLRDESGQSANDSIGKLTKVSDLPSKKQLTAWIKAAMKLNEEGVTRRPKTQRRPQPAASMPDDFSAALKQNRKSGKAFDALSPSHRREYVEWITEAKRPDTRQRRIAQALEWIAEGKSRNWKYM
jgi:uncharacterized protein YdeI (YjbR/CyaY-like superfamily)